MTLQRKTPLRAKLSLLRKNSLRSKPKYKQENFEISDIKKVTKHADDKKKHINELDKVFQFYIRLRDSRSDGFCQCISCGKYVPFSHIQAGHFRSRVHMSTRWNELNVNGECATCNLEIRNGDHLLDYRHNLVKKIGEKKVQWIEAYCKEPRKWSDFEIIVLIKDYCKKCQALSKQKGIPISTTVQRIIKKYSSAGI